MFCSTCTWCLGLYDTVQSVRSMPLVRSSYPQLSHAPNSPHGSTQTHQTISSHQAVLQHCWNWQNDKLLSTNEVFQFMHATDALNCAVHHQVRGCLDNTCIPYTGNKPHCGIKSTRFPTQQQARTLRIAVHSTPPFDLTHTWIAPRLYWELMEMGKATSWVKGQDYCSNCSWASKVQQIWIHVLTPVHASHVLPKKQTHAYPRKFYLRATNPAQLSNLLYL